MKNKMIALMATAALLAVGLTIQAQTNTSPPAIVTASPISAASIQALLADGIITVGVPVTVKGQTFVVNTNEAGNYVISTSGAGGTATVTPPSTLQGVAAEAQSMMQANNPTNRGYYGTNELVARLGAVYLQNSGQAAIEIGIEKYGWLKFISPNLGIGAALFQGNKGGQSGTAGAVGFIDYRKVIGDVSLQVGVGGGYDNWNRTAMGVVKLDLELRQSHNIGEYVRVGYALERGGIADSSKGGLIVGGGINYSFKDFNILGIGGG